MKWMTGSLIGFGLAFYRKLLYPDDRARTMMTPESAEGFRVARKRQVGIRRALLIVAIFGFALATLKSTRDKSVRKFVYLRDYYRDQAWDGEAFRRALLIEAHATADREKAARLRRWAGDFQTSIALSRRYAALASDDLEALDSHSWVTLPWVASHSTPSVPVPPEYYSPPERIVVPYHPPMPKDPDATAIGIFDPLAPPH